MTRFLFSAVFFAPALVFAQVERAADVRVAPGPVAGPVSVSPASSPLPLSAAAPSAAPLAAPLSAAAPALAAPAPAAAPALARPAALPTAMLAAPETVMRAAPAAEARTPGARGELTRGAAPAGNESDSGRLTFDGQTARAASPSVAAGRLAAADGPRLGRPAAPAAAAPARSIPLKQRLGETAELGVMAGGFHILTGLLYLMLGAHAAFPLVAGAFWALAGAELIKQLGNLRSVVVGGWQASHDQKYRVDPSTGRLKDIRGKKYGEDRYDELAPGAVSPRERLVTDAAAFALGLPWVLPAGPQAVALYAVGAAAVFALRRALARRAGPAPARKTDFEYDR